MYRKLSQMEIGQLQQQGCYAKDWNRIDVVDGFNPDFVVDVTFSGDVKMGVFNNEFEQAGGFSVHSGVYHARLHNVVIGNDCYIDRIHNYIANYIIGNDVFIENSNLIVVDRPTSFGNGVRVPVMNEFGGREVPIYDNLSAHLAYILTLYRHDKDLIAHLEDMIDDYSDKIKSEVGHIDDHVRIVNCGTIKNVRIGAYATLGGVSKLNNGSINSNQIAPVHLGSGVKCKDFILCSGVDITDSTLVSHCFVGQGSIMGRHYSALDSLFFANCQGFHGEATAIFAGPYTVSHHKSSLLIAGMYSFLNAGSGSNQSNHMYKLGPIHQGMAERGSKTTSDSYILWPARIGAFTLVMGRHTKHSDTTDLPFSYLIENATESFLVPAINIRSVGTVRDAQKWPKRDNRKDVNKLDCINFNLLSPYTIQKMYKGIDLLRDLQKMAGANNEIYSYHNCKIRNSSLVKGIDLYRIAIIKFLGNSLISRIGREPIEDMHTLRNKLKPTTEIGLGEWLDISGLIVPKSEIDKLVEDIVDDRLSLHDVEERFAQMHNNYYEYEWTWAYDKIARFLKKDASNVAIDDLISLISVWKDSVVSLDKMLYSDAKKEFDLNSKTGFGVDGDESVKMRDFESVRGSFDSNPFVQECLNHIERKSKLADNTIALLKNIR